MKTKEMRGITLVALVVTIVVLLILAGVSINNVLGDDGIIQKAKDAAEATKRASAEEEMNRLVLEYQLASNDETLESFLQEKVTEGRIDGVTDNGDGTITITKKVEGKDYTITVKNPVAPTPSVKVGAIRVVSDSTGAGSSLGEASTRKGTTLYIMIESTISGGTTTVSPQVPYAVTENGTYKFTVTGTVNGTAYTKEVSVEVNQFRKFSIDDIQIGDSVNYTYDPAGSYSLASTYSGYSSNQTIAQTTGLTWKVLNVDKENDTVDIISTNPTSSTVYFKNILGYNNGPYFMNEICKAQYSNATLGVEARSINLLDMEKHLTPTGITNRNAYKYNSDTVKYGTTKTYTSNTKYPSLYANQKGAGPNVSSISQLDTTKGNDPYEESKPIVPKGTTEPTTSSTYGTGNSLTVTQTYYYIPINDTNYGTASSILANSTWFWVAARYVTAGSSSAGFGLRRAYTNTYGCYMFGSDGDTDGKYCALRPVVSLPSSLLTGEQTNGAWNLSK